MRLRDPRMFGSYRFCGTDSSRRQERPCHPLTMSPSVVSTTATPYSATLDYGDPKHGTIEDNALAKISAYYSLVFPNITFYLQTLTVTIGRRCIPTSSSVDAGDSTAHNYNPVDVDLGPLKSVSRLHARIEYEEEDERFVLVVIGRNGAWVDGVWSGAGSRVPLGERSVSCLFTLLTLLTTLTTLTTADHRFKLHLAHFISCSLPLQRRRIHPHRPPILLFRVRARRLLTSRLYLPLPLYPHTLLPRERRLHTDDRSALLLRNHNSRTPMQFPAHQRRKVLRPRPL